MEGRHALLAGTTHTTRQYSQWRMLFLTSCRWNEDTFGPHFTVSPLEGMIAPLTEAGMEVVFTPEGVDDDIRKEGVLCMIEV